MNFQSIIDSVSSSVGGCIRMLKEGYSIDVDDGSSVSRASSGKARIRRLYSTERHTFTVPVGPMPRAAVAEFYSQYNTYKNTVDELTDPLTGISYSVLWTSPPVVASVSGKLATMEFSFTGTAP